MKICLVIQIALCSLVMAERSVDLFGNHDGWWFHVTPQRGPPPSELPCLVRSKPIVRRNDYTYTPGIGGHKVHTIAATWAQARRTCKEEGGHLAIINSDAESQAIAVLWQNAGPVQGATGDANYALAGYHDMFEEGEFVTIHDVPIGEVGFAIWEAGEPNNAGVGEHCGAVNKSGQLNDNPCYKLYAFICEVPEVEE